MGRPVIMICSEERDGPFPFDIHHRKVITYTSESPSDFDVLKKKITDTANALLNTAVALKHIEETSQLASQEGLSQHELYLLAILAGDTAIPETLTYPYSLRNNAERAGLTPLAFGLAFRKLMKKELIELQDAYNEQNDENYKGVQLTALGWKWIDANEALFSLKKNIFKAEDFLDDDIPF